LVRREGDRTGFSQPKPTLVFVVGSNVDRHGEQYLVGTNNAAFEITVCIHSFFQFLAF
jgi:hypothetical protein